MIGALFLAALQIATAQPSTTKASRCRLQSRLHRSAKPGSNLTVYLLTMGPGDQVWEKFGHNAIWIHDDAAMTDIAYHWGLFDFADKDFVPRFIQGRMRYSMGAFDMSQTVDAYRQTNRTVWAQELNLTPAQRQKLADFIAWNIQPRKSRLRLRLLSRQLLHASAGCNRQCPRWSDQGRIGKGSVRNNVSFSHVATHAG